MSLSEEKVLEEFKSCYSAALNARKCGDLATAKSELNKAASCMEKLAMGAMTETRNKYRSIAKRLRGLADTICTPEKSLSHRTGSDGSFLLSPQEPFGGEAELSTGLEEFFTILPREKLSFGFESVIGLDQAKEAITEYVINPVRYPDAYSYNFLDNHAVLLEGPPGTGKTTFAKAVAKEIGVPFALVKTSALINCYIGETAKNIDKIFALMRRYVLHNNTPVIVFFDELDEISRKRGSEDKASGAAVPALLRNLDGMETNRNLFVLASTNLAEALDPAILERFRKLIYIPLPAFEDRKKLFEGKLSDIETRYFETLDLDQAARLSSGLSGRDITFICDDFKHILSRMKASLIDVVDLSDELYSLIKGRVSEKGIADIK